MFRTESATITL